MHARIGKYKIHKLLSKGVFLGQTDPSLLSGASAVLTDSVWLALSPLPRRDRVFILPQSALRHPRLPD